MGTWDWDDVPNKTLALEGAPKAAQLAASIVPDETLSDDWHKSVQDQTGLPQLGLIEWSVSDEVQSIFPILRMMGSKVGYVVEQGAELKPVDYFREISLDDQTASQISAYYALDMPMAFVDEQQICALMSYHSDYALIALRADVFQEWIDKGALDLTMWGDQESYPPPQNLEEAKKLALRRQADWDARWKKSNKP